MISGTLSECLSYGLDPDQDWSFMDADLGPNCLQRTSAGEKSLV